MNRYVTDTHALIWYLVGSSRLSHRARAVFDEAVAGNAQVVIPAIVIAEMIMLAEKHRAIQFRELLSELQAVPGFQFAPLTPDTAITIHQLTILPDIHDRLITAEALHQGSALITADGRITDAGLVDVIW
jgi:PIN domain nuclease of toxin-antitoxin system